MGSLTLNGATSGQITLNPPAVAGTNTLTLPAATGTLITTASSGALPISALSTTGTPTASTYLDGTGAWSTPASIPAGSVMPYAGSSAPSGWLLCSGAAVSRTTYAALFAIVGTTYGAGDGSTTFNLPDMRGRLAAGVDNMGGTAANRITSGGSGITGTTLGAAGGAETFTIAIAQMPSHSHTLSVGSGATSGGNGGWYAVFQNASGQTNPAPQNTGGGGASNVTQPTMMLNYIIKT